MLKREFEIQERMMGRCIVFFLRGDTLSYLPGYIITVDVC
jgi:hypothetical protein